MVVAGWTSASSYKNVAVVRYTAEGELDTSFDGNGRLATDLGANSRGLSVSIQRGVLSSRIVVAGYRGSAAFFGRHGTVVDATPAESDMVILRYQPDGSLDDTFGGDGIVYPDFGNGVQSVAQSVLIQGTVLSPSILVAGFTGVQEPGPGADLEVAVARVIPWPTQGLALMPIAMASPMESSTFSLPTHEPLLPIH
ncbi:MAG: hypothetical protein ACR2OZ_16270 [Verrucomicrobiales bacterium]